MKKLSLVFLAIVLCFALVACGRRNKPAETTIPSKENSTIPGMDPTIMDPTIHTNIPDPEIDNTMPKTNTENALLDPTKETTK